MKDKQTRYESIGVIVTKQVRAEWRVDESVPAIKTPKPSFVDKKAHSRFIDNLLFANGSS